MRGTVIHFLSVIIGLSISSSKAYRICYNCIGAASPADCDRLTRCGNNEECFEETIVTNYSVFYNSGCRSKLVCQTSREILIGKRSASVGCSKCCDTDFCNVGLCGGGTERGLRCLSCDYQTMRSNDCEHIAMCGEDQMCYAHSAMNRADNDLRYETGCMSKLQCHGVQQVPLINMCFECCDTPMCNKFKCGLNRTDVSHTKSETSSTVATPRSTVQLYHAFISGLTSLSYHGNGNLMCKSNAIDASYTWKFNEVILPMERNNILYIHDMTEAKVGTYTCVVFKDGVTVETKSNVTITEAPATVISVSSSPRPPHIGVALNISCETTGFPVPVVRWSFTNSEGHSYVPGDVNLSLYGILHIQSFRKDSHGGNWTCFATNKLGNSSLGIVIN